MSFSFLEAATISNAIREACRSLPTKLNSVCGTHVGLCRSQRSCGTNRQTRIYAREDLTAPRLRHELDSAERSEYRVGASAMPEPGRL